MLNRLQTWLDPTKETGADSRKLSRWLRWGLPLLVILACRMPYFGMEILNSDEGLYAATARIMMEGGVLYEDAWEHAAPGIFYLYKTIFSIFGAWNMLAIRYITILAHLAAALLIGRDVRIRYGDVPGVFAGVLAALAIGGYLPQDAVASITEIFMLPFLLLAARSLYRWTETGEGSVVLTGLWIAITAWFKIHGLLILILILAGAWIARYVVTRKRVFTFPIFALLASAGWYIVLLMPLLFDGGFNAFFRIYIKYNLFYAGAGGYDWGFIGGVWTKIWDWALPQWLAVALALMFLTAYSANRRKLRSKKIFLGGALVGSFLVATIGGRLFGHYFIPAAAFTAWLGAEGFALLYCQSRRNRIDKKSPPVRVALVAMALGILLPIVYFHGGAYRHQRLIELDGEPLKSRYPDLVEKTREVTPEDEDIWVWGFAPELYVLSKRDPANRFVKCDYLVGLVPWVNVEPHIDTTPYIIEGSWQLLGQDMTRNPPAVIIDCAEADYQYYGKYPMDNNAQLKAFVETHYTDLGRYDSQDLRLLDYFIGQGRFYLFRLYLRKDLALKQGLMETPEAAPGENQHQRRQGKE